VSRAAGQGDDVSAASRGGGTGASRNVAVGASRPDGDVASANLSGGAPGDGRGVSAVAGWRRGATEARRRGGAAGSTVER
jgi:hypothetical protein